MTLTFKVNIRVIHVHVLTKFHDPMVNSFLDMNFFLVIFFLVDFYSSDFFSSQTDGQTDRRTDGQTQGDA